MHSNAFMVFLFCSASVIVRSDSMSSLCGLGEMSVIHFIFVCSRNISSYTKHKIFLFIY